MTFDFNFWLGFLGLLFTIISGILSIYLVKSKKYPGKIIYIEEQSIGLFDSLVKNFPQINIDYEGSKISEQIVLLKGCFLNTGSIDIKESMVEKKLNISLPDGFKWLTAKIVDGSLGNKFTIKQIGDNILEIDFSLFKRNEYLRFEALAEVSINLEEYKHLTPDFLLSQEISFAHRIADTSSIEKQNFDLKTSEGERTPILITIVFPLIITLIVVFMTFFSVSIYHELKTNGELHYIIKTPSKDTLEVLAKPQIDNTFKVSTKDKKFERVIKKDEFFSNYVIKTKISKIEDEKLGLSSIYLLPILMLLVYVSLAVTLIPRINKLRTYRKIKQIKTIIGIEA